MKFFKCHSQKMKDDRIIRLQDKFTDIGPDVFSGCAARYILLAETTTAIRDFAFSGLNECNIYMPRSIEDIELKAFENIHPSTVFFCVRGSYAEKVCNEYDLNVNTNISELTGMIEAEEREKREAEERKRFEEETRLKLEEERLKLEQERLRLEEEARKRAEEEAKRKIEEEARLKAEAEAKVKAEMEAKAKAEAEKPAPAPINISEPENDNSEDETRMIKIFTFDDRNGETVRTMRYFVLPDVSKRFVKNSELYIHAEYKSNTEYKTFVTKEEYNKIKEKSSVNDASFKNCPFCSNKIQVNDTFCAYCGKKVIEVTYCGNCGKPNSKQDNFCAFCGTHL